MLIPTIYARKTAGLHFQPVQCLYQFISLHFCHSLCVGSIVQPSDFSFLITFPAAYVAPAVNATIAVKQSNTATKIKTKISSIVSSPLQRRLLCLYIFLLRFDFTPGGFGDHRRFHVQHIGNRYFLRNQHSERR